MIMAHQQAHQFIAIEEYFFNVKLLQHQGETNFFITFGSFNSYLIPDLPRVN